MSRVGKKIINVPDEVKISFSEKDVRVSGPMGVLCQPVPSFIDFSFSEGKLSVFLKEKINTIRSQYSDKYMRSMWGTIRSLLNNMVEGVTKGFSVKLEIVGVGYRALVDKQVLTLFLGYSHPIKYSFDEDIKISCGKSDKKSNNFVTIMGVDKQKVCYIASFLTKLKKFDPYKSKGIFISGSFLIKKEGKKK